MYSTSSNTALPVLGFPIRRSAGQRLFSASPRLIAAVHVLLRLLMPRHPPCALHILTVSPSDVCIVHGWGLYPFISMLAIVQFSSFTEDGRRGIPATRSLKTEQRFDRDQASRLCATESGRRFRNAVRGSRRTGERTPQPSPDYRSRERPLELPRKEVIQPQLPLRLPCYDFTPITSPTFDGCLP